jgi:hypothetical protein
MRWLCFVVLTAAATATAKPIFVDYTWTKPSLIPASRIDESRVVSKQGRTDASPDGEGGPAEVQSPGRTAREGIEISVVSVTLFTGG